MYNKDEEVLESKTSSVIKFCPQCGKENHEDEWGKEKLRCSLSAVDRSNGGVSYRSIDVNYIEFAICSCGFRFKVIEPMK